MERVLKLAFIGASIKRGVERLYTAFLCPCPCLCVWHSGAFVIQRARYSSSLGIGACATRERTVPRVIIPLEKVRIDPGRETVQWSIQEAQVGDDRLVFK